MKIDNISYSFPQDFALKNIKFDLGKGQILGLIGHSGSGKSTLLKIMAGLLEPDSGTVFFDGEVLPPPSKKLIPGHEKIKMVTQQSSLFPNINIAENICYEIRYFTKEYQQKRLKYLAKRLNISHLLGKKVSELSGGEIQRAMLAKSLADEPSVLLLDEPFANLDSLNKKRIILELIKVLKNENISCVLVTHEIRDAFGIVDNLLILKNGKFIQSGTSEQIYFSPKNEYVAKLTGEAFISADRKYFFRPEDIILDSEGEYQTRVLNNVFLGANYEVFIEIEGRIVFFFSKKPLELNSEIGVSIQKSYF